ncbi:hypothetical protein MRB53_038986 [Persea americana]|nr:hypothetical protein MRB53_038986 [Persea americana]
MESALPLIGQAKEFADGVHAVWPEQNNADIFSEDENQLINRPVEAVCAQSLGPLAITDDTAPKTVSAIDSEPTSVFSMIFEPHPRSWSMYRPCSCKTLVRWRQHSSLVHAMSYRSNPSMFYDKRIYIPGSVGSASAMHLTIGNFTRALAEQAQPASTIADQESFLSDHHVFENNC